MDRLTQLPIFLIDLAAISSQTLVEGLASSSASWQAHFFPLNASTILEAGNSKRLKLKLHSGTTEGHLTASFSDGFSLRYFGIGAKHVFILLPFWEIYMFFG